MKYKPSINRIYVYVVIIIALLTFAVNGFASYSIVRPIQTTGGQINQTYLWGEESDDRSTQHKGIDFSYPTGTNVYAVDAGTVVQFQEDLDNGERLSPWGNFVLIQHDRRHYDRSSGLWGYIYSMYLHLSKNSVIPNAGDHIDRGAMIAQSDDTGSGSTGPHLHFQVVVHALDNRKLVPNTLDANNKSRNPELWLKEYNSNTSRMVGKITFSDGTARPNVIICGAAKPYGGYIWSRTYSYDWANPDDYYLENFGTVDITPGTYHLYAYEYRTPDDGCGVTPLVKDLGWYTFNQNKTTFVGLYPVYVPVSYSDYYGWNSEIIIRNNSISNSASVSTTFFYSNGEAIYQRTDTISPEGTINLSPVCGGCILSALIVSSQDISVAVHNQHISGKDYSYAGISDVDSLNPGWGKIGTTLYAPVIMRNYYGWYTEIILRNTSISETANGTINYYSPDGSATPKTFSIPANGQFLTNYDAGASNTLYSAVISSSQPLAAVVRQYNSNISETYNAFSSGSTTTHVPIVMNYYYGWHTSVNIQNISGSPANITIYYYHPNGALARTPRTDTIPAYASRSYYSPNEGLPSPNFIGSAKITSNRNIVVATNQSTYITGIYRGSSYSGTLSGSAYVVIPNLLNHWGSEDWVSSVNVRNLGASATNMYISFDNATPSPWNINVNGSKSVYIPDYWGTNGIIGPALVWTDNGQPISVVINQSSATLTSDYARSYNGFNR